MTSGNTNWEIELLKRRFDFEPLDIAYEQAEKIYEQEQSIGSIIHNFSVWEKLDYQLSYLKGILTANQLTKFIESENKGLRGFEESLVKQDKEAVKQLEVAEEQRTYYTEKLLPAIFSDYSLLLLGFDSERPKIDYLKAAYRKYLEHKKKEIYISHFRNSRGFQPNGLKLLLIHHQIACLFPDYKRFKEHMDEPTTAIKDYLVKKLWYYSCSIDEKLKAILQGLQDFTAEAAKNQLGEIQGWHSIHYPSDKQEQEYRLMCLVLLDKDRYSY